VKIPEILTKRVCMSSESEREYLDIVTVATGDIRVNLYTQTNNI